MKRKKTIAAILFASLLAAGIGYASYSLQAFPGSITISGKSLSRLDSPTGAATDDSYVYVANSKQHRVMVFDLKGNFQFPIGSPGVGEGQLQFPADVELHGGKVYVADLGNNRIQVFSKDGQFLDYFPRERNIKPAAISIRDSKIYVADIYSQKIRVFSLSGKPLDAFGSTGSGKGQFNYPNGIAATQSGQIVVADTQNRRVQVLNENGKYAASIKKEGDFGLPKGIAISDGKIYIADALNKAVYSFNEDGSYDAAVEVGAALEYPSDVSVSNNYIVITDYGSNNVILLKKGGN